MTSIISDIMFSLLGRAFLFIRYRDSQKVRKVLADEYEDSYTQAGIILILWVIGFILLLGIGASLLVSIYAILHHNPRLT